MYLYGYLGFPKFSYAPAAKTPIWPSGYKKPPVVTTPPPCLYTVARGVDLLQLITSLGGSLSDITSLNPNVDLNQLKQSGGEVKLANKFCAALAKQEQSCSPGTKWDAVAQRCTCPAGNKWDTRLHRCIPALCPQGQVWNDQTQSCGLPTDSFLKLLQNNSYLFGAAEQSDVGAPTPYSSSRNAPTPTCALPAVAATVVLHAYPPEWNPSNPHGSQTTYPNPPVSDNAVVAVIVNNKWLAWNGTLGVLRTSSMWKNLFFKTWDTRLTFVNDVNNPLHFPCNGFDSSVDRLVIDPCPTGQTYDKRALMCRPTAHYAPVVRAPVAKAPALVRQFSLADGPEQDGTVGSLEDLSGVKDYNHAVWDTRIAADVRKRIIRFHDALVAAKVPVDRFRVASPQVTIFLDTPSAPFNAQQLWLATVAANQAEFVTTTSPRIFFPKESVPVTRHAPVVRKNSYVFGAPEDSENA
jgi:hypothetical protein